MKKRGISPMIKEVFLRIFSKPATGRYPFIKAEITEDFRGKQIFNIDLCVSCGLCARDCPSKAIEMVDVDGKRRPLFHLDLCIFCYQCAESCPRNAIRTSTIFEMASAKKSDLEIKPKTIKNGGHD